jgi:hypothetical protein
MEISFNSNFGVRQESFDAGSVGKGSDTQGATRAAGLSSNLTVGDRAAELSSAEPVADVPESALMRDDELGNLVSSAFNLPAPPPPPFSD